MLPNFSECNSARLRFSQHSVRVAGTGLLQYLSLCASISQSLLQYRSICLNIAALASMFQYLLQYLSICFNIAAFASVSQYLLQYLLQYRSICLSTAVFVSVSQYLLQYRSICFNISFETRLERLADFANFVFSIFSCKDKGILLEFLFSDY